MKKPGIILLCLALCLGALTGCGDIVIDPATTPAPIDAPTKKLMSKKIRLPDELTAANASLPRKLPTIHESAVL